mmetsp:Transcript_19347/g.41657  ORF Transcript_19347/g.41657 Transcript_19347/m.41657 type:complete len:1150 (+) Transcript_19347:227-3676(+)
MQPSPPSTTSGVRSSVRQPAGGFDSTRTSSSRRASTESQASSERNSNRFFRKFLNHRANDYHSEPTSGGPRVARPVPTINERAEAVEMDDYENGSVSRPSFMARICGNEGWTPARRRKVFKRTLKSTPWRLLIIVCSLILLFGGQVRTLAFEEPADLVFDIIFIGIFCIFIIDIALRIDAEDNYFKFSMGGCCKPKEDNSQPAAARARTDQSGWGDCNFRFGSFLFFCELASTLALFHEISYIHQQNFDELRIDIRLDAAGIPVSGMDDVNESTPIEYTEFGLLFTIAKTARVARFIRSTGAIKLSSRVNWFAIFNFFNPLWYLSKCRKTTHTTEEKLRTSASLEMAGSAGRVSAESRNGTRRNSSWGRAGLGAAASVGRPNIVLRWLGFKRSNEGVKRNIAATKIQRAWRKAHQNAAVHELDHSERDFAWNARSSKVSQAPARSMQQGGSRSQYSRASHRSPLAHNYGDKKQNESQVGSAMRELTVERVAVGIIMVLVLTVLFTYTENNATRPATMIVLHNQTANALFADRSIQAARDSSAPDLFQYTFANGTSVEYVPNTGEKETENLRDRETLHVTVTDSVGSTTAALFSNREEAQQEAVVSIISTVFIILVWFFGVTAFVGPVMVLVVIPIERMVRLLGMLTLDPLGYQSTARYRKFVAEEDEITKNTRWTKEILRGMETSFLMLTILRIGSLMKVGFGSAGVEIIRNNLARSQTKNTLILSEKGSTVSCIFLFCDIRQFTDATECLQEEVFVFTNRIAGVVHSICHSFGGSANKNIGDAFLVSWRLEEKDDDGFGSDSRDKFTAKHNQADKALLSVVKICMALHYDDYYIETMSDTAREALLAKLSKRSGPVVQLGFGLHAGKAVQGAIGSQRKIDATYVSEAVERAEFLESSTKKYGVKMLMSDNFHRLLHPNNRRRCRKVDQIMLQDGDEDDYEEGEENIMELMTFDMDIDALWKNVSKSGTGTGSIVQRSDDVPGSDGETERRTPKVRKGADARGIDRRLGRRISVRMPVKEASDELSEGGFLPAAAASSASNADLTGDGDNQANNGPPELVLPTGPALYNQSVWVSEDMRRIRQLYSDGIFFQKFNSGLNSFYSRDWEHARQCFVTILERFEDGPSRYFLTQIEKNNGKPPRNFRPYGLS